MSLEKMGQSIESNEVKVRLQATPEDVENVKIIIIVLWKKWFFRLTEICNYIFAINNFFREK